jgi:hypothetical protein
LVWERPELLAETAEQLVGAVRMVRVIEQDDALGRLRQLAYAAHERHDGRGQAGIGLELWQVKLVGHESQQVACAAGSPGVDEHRPLAGVSEVHRELVKRGALARAGRPHEQDVAVGENLFEQQTLEVRTRYV